MKPLHIVAIVLAASAVVAVLISRRPPSPTPSPSALTPGGEAPRAAAQGSDAQLAALLAALGQNRRFSDQAIRAKENVARFPMLARSKQEPRIVAAALLAMAKTHERVASEMPSLLSVYNQAVLDTLEADADEVVGAALLAAGPLISGPQGGQPAVSKIVRLAPRFPTGAGRYALIDALSTVDAGGVTAGQLDIVVDALADANPYVVSRALRELQVRSADLGSRDEYVAARARALLASEDAGVRGRSAALLAALGGVQPDELLRLLEDRHGYVRGQACMALARVGTRDHIKNILKIADSTVPASYAICGWTTLAGEPGCETHNTSSSGLLGEVAAQAIALLARGQILLEPLSGQDAGAALARNKKSIEEWFARSEADPTTNTTR
jgi:hypothetical protein